MDASLTQTTELSQRSENVQSEDVDKQAKCDPNKAIPLHYQQITKQQHQAVAIEKAALASHDPDSGDSLGREESPEPGLANQMTVFNRSLLSQGSWHSQSKALLVRKAAIAYYGLTEAMMTCEKYILAWKYITMALFCFSK